MANLNKQDCETLPDTRKNRAKGVDPAKVAELLQRGLSRAQIGKICGVSRQAIDSLVKRHGLDLEAVAHFRKNKSAIMESVQARLIGSITDSDVARMSPRDRILAFGILYDKTRLEKGESTSNISLFSRAVIEACEG